MSHVVAGKVVITDMECLQRALKRFPNLEWRQSQKKFGWYGRWVNDYAKEDAAYKLGIDTDQYGTCDHAIHMKGVSYEIGLVKRKDGTGWSLVWDFYGQGQEISQYIGVGGEKLITAYQEEVLNKHAEDRYGFGWNVTEEDDEWKEMELEVEE